MYTVLVDFGAGNVDISAYLVGRYPIKRTRSLHNGLKPVIGTCEFLINRSTDIINDFLTASTDPEVTILKDGAAYFKGTVRRTVKVSVGQLRVDALRCQCVDVLYRMDSRKIRTSFVWSNYKISDPSTKTASILHQLFYLAGYADAELNFTEIDVTVDKFALDGTDKAIDCRKAIEDVLRDVVYTLRPTESGVIELFNLYPASYTATETLLTGTGGNIAEGYDVERDEYKAEAVDVTYWTHDTIADAVVFEDTTGATAALPCSIPVAAGAYYPDGADATTSIRCVFKLQDYDIVAVDSPAIVWAHTGDVTKAVETIDGLGMLVKFSSATGGVITKFQIVGDATVKLDKCKAEAEIVASSDEREDLTSEIIYTKTDAARIANGRAAWHKNATFKYRFSKITLSAMSDETLYPALDLYPDTTLYPWGDVMRPGQIVTLSDAALLGASSTLRVIEVIDGGDPKTFAIVCEGVGDYTASATYGAPALSLPKIARKYPATIPLAADPLGASPDTADFVGQYGVYGGTRYACTALPDTWERDDAGQTAAEVIAAVPSYSPQYLGAWKDTSPVSAAKEGDVYLRYSETPNTVDPPTLADPPDYRGVFKYSGSAWVWTTDPADMFKAIRDIVDICKLLNAAGTAALYGIEADYGVTESIDTAHIGTALIDFLRGGTAEFSGDVDMQNGTVRGVLDTPVLKTTEPQTGDEIAAPAFTHWPGSTLITHCAGLADGEHAVDATSTFGGKNVTKIFKGGTTYAPYYQRDDAIEDTDSAAWLTMKTLVSTVEGPIRIFYSIKPAAGSYVASRILINGVSTGGYGSGDSTAYLTCIYLAFLHVDDVVELQIVSLAKGSVYCSNFRICPDLNTIGVYNDTDSTSLAISSTAYITETGNINIAALDDFIAAHTHWNGLAFITLFAGKVRTLIEQLVAGHTFNSKTPLSVYITGTSSIRITFTDTTALIVYANLYYSYPTTDHIDLLTDPGEISMFDDFTFNPENYGSDLLFKLYYLTTLLFQIYPEGRMLLTAGRAPSGAIHTASTTEEALFEMMKTHIPATGDILCVHGFCNGFVVSRASRVSATEIGFNGYRLSDGVVSSFTITDGDTSPTFAASMTW